MKKVFVTLLAMVMLLTSLAIGNAESYNFPQKIQDTLKNEQLSGYSISSYIDRAGNSPYFSFVLLQNDDGHNILYVFEENAGGWKLKCKTSAAIPQGIGRTYVCVEDEETMIIAQENDSQEYWIKSVTYKLGDDSNWYLTRYYDRSRKMNVDVKSNGLTYYGGLDYDESEGSVRGTVQTDMRYVNLTSIPSTLHEAKIKYTTAPSIPAGMLKAQKIKFSGGKSYAVYSGPGEEYMRGANGKAAVSTNDWIQVFGKENGWILIQYAISKDHMRFGWIPEQALPKGANVGSIQFTPVSAYTKTNISVTDDPLFSKSNLLSLPEGCWVTWLATMGDWAYIESSTGDVLRGFVPVSDLRTDMQFNLSNWPVGDTPVLDGILTYDPISYMVDMRIKRAINSPITEELVSFTIYDGILGNELCTIDAKENDGAIIGSFVAPAKTTTIKIVGKDTNGIIYSEWAVVIEW